MAITVLQKNTKPSTKIVGVDVSTRTGFARVRANEDGVEILDVAEFTAERGDGTRGMVARADAIGSQVVAQLQVDLPDMLIIEGYSFGSKFNHESMYTLGAVLRHLLYVHEISWYDVPPTSLKKFVTGAGNVKKDVMMKEVYKRWGFEGTDNQCDAVGLAMWGAAVFDYVDLPKPNLKTVADWKKAYNI